MSAPIDVRPFSNGSEAESWCAANCDRCRLNGYRLGGAVCVMEESVALGSMLGTIPADVATEYGATIDGDYCDLPKQCPQFAPPPACEWVTHPKRRAKPKCGKPATGEHVERGYRYAVCAKHAKAAAAGVAPEGSAP